MRIIFLLPLIIILSACGPTGKHLELPASYVPTEGLVSDDTDYPTIIFRRPKAPTLAEYHTFIIDPVVVDYNDPDIKEIDPEDINKLSQYFQQALRRELEASNYKVTTRSGPETLRMTFVIKNIKASPIGGTMNVAVIAAGALIGVPGIVSVSTGEITVEAIFREASTNRIDAVVITRSAGSQIFKSKPWSTWADVEGSLDLWAEGIREAVDEAHERHNLTPSTQTPPYLTNQ